MGRGRAKAKQTKVARELKYHSPDMDLERLKSDLGAGDILGRVSAVDDGDGSETSDADGFDDPYADVVDGEEQPPRRR